MRIAICEDEEVLGQKLWNMLFDKPQIEAKCFYNPLELIKNYENGERYDILLCDICMEPMDGISLCRKIREFDSEVYIVFMSGYIEYAPKGYEVNAFRYLLKPITKENLEQVLTEIKENTEKTEKLLLKTAEGSIILKPDHILYAEILDKETKVYCDNDTVTVNKSLGELEDELSKEMFFRIHRKYLVNLERVREFDRCHLTLDNGKNLPVSVRKSAEFKKALYDFLDKK